MCVVVRTIMRKEQSNAGAEWAIFTIFVVLQVCCLKQQKWLQNRSLFHPVMKYGK